MSCKIFPFLFTIAIVLPVIAQKPGSQYRFKNAEVFQSETKEEAVAIELPSAAAHFESVRKATVLVKNEDELLPIKDLADTRVAFLPIGLPANSLFEKVLKRYTLIHRLTPPPSNDGRMALEWVESLKGQYDVVVIGIEDRYQKKQAYFDSHFAINMVIEEFPNMTVVFGGGDIFRYLPTIKNSEVLIVSPQEERYSESVAAQAIFGAVSLEGRLKSTLGSGLLAGMGMDAEKRGLLQYGPPELTGMNAQLLEDSLRAIVEEGIRAKAYPGAQVLVAHKGQVVYHQTFGFHTYDSLKQVKEDDLYDFASVTKVTGALPALMKLHGEGQFDLDAPLMQYVPKFKRSNKSELTFRSMLAHHSRLMPWIPYWRNTVRKNGKFKGGTFKPGSTRKYSVRVTENLWLNKNYKKKIFKAIKKSPLNEEPGFVYSGLLFYLLPDIVSELTQEDFETYLKGAFYKPIGAHTITYNPYKYFSLDRIVPTERDTFFRMTQLHGYVHDEGAAMMGGVSSNAGLFGTANDLAKLFQMYMNYGQYGGKQIIPGESVKEFTRCQYCPEDNHRGLGFDKPQPFNPAQNYTALSASPESFGHSGYTGTFVWADPKAELLVIFFSNRVYPTRDNRRLYELNIRPRLHQAVYNAVEK